MKFTRLMAAAAMAMPLAALPGVAHAEEADEEASGPIDISAEVGVFSDYRFRGISLSGKDPEVTASLSIEHESGLYASAWVSNVDLGTGSADDVEIDWTAGFSTDVGAVNLDAGVIYYQYPGNGSFNYVEFYGAVGTKVGPADVKVGVAYAPRQDNIGGLDNTYVYIAGELPIGDGPLSLHGQFGIEDGAFGDAKRDWLIGASFDLGSGFTASADYVDTARSYTTAGDPTVVVSLKKSF